VGKGFFPPPEYQDHIVLNRWMRALKPKVLCRGEAVLMPPPTVDRPPKTGAPRHGNDATEVLRAAKHIRLPHARRASMFRARVA
jgi:hypothetical protein